MGGLNLTPTDTSIDSILEQGMYYQNQYAKFYLVIHSPYFAKISWQFEIGWQSLEYIKVRHTNTAGVTWTEWKSIALQ